MNINNDPPLLQTYYGEPCPYCGSAMMGWKRPSNDHMFPRWRGGQLTDENRLVVCEVCNREKGGRSLTQWLNKLQKRKDPRAPRIAALVKELNLPNRQQRLRAEVAAAVEAAREQETNIASVNVACKS